MLRTTQLNKRYPRTNQSPIDALCDVSIAFPDTGLVFVCGKSGSGKSTLLNILGGLDNATSGTVTILGADASRFTEHEWNAYRKDHLGFVFQDFNLLPEFTVFENIRLALDLQHQPFDEEQLRTVLHQLDLSDIEDCMPNELSGGQIQRIAIARAIMKHTRVLLADEPTGNLDDDTAAKVFETFRAMADEQLVIVVTHDVEAARLYGDRIIHISNGRITSDTTSNHVTTSSSASVLPAGAPRQSARSLPLRAAWRLARSSLHHRLGRRIVTMIVIILSLSFFGLSDLIGQFSIGQASYNTFQNTHYRILPFARRNTDESSAAPRTLPPSPADVQWLSAHDIPADWLGYHVNTEFYELVVDDIPYYNQYYIQFVSGVIEVPDQSALNLPYQGAFPTATDQLMINNYMLEHFIDFGFQYWDPITATTVATDNVVDFSDVVGKQVQLRVGMGFRTFEIVGMVQYDLDYYHDLKPRWNRITEHSSYDDTRVIEFAADQYSFLSRFIVAQGFYVDNITDARKATSFSVANLGNSQDVVVTLSDFMLPGDLTDEQRAQHIHHDTIDVSVLDTIDPVNYQFDGDVPTWLEDDEIIVPSSWFDDTLAANLNTFLGTTVTLSLITMHDDGEYYETVEYERELTIVGFYTGDYFYMNYNVIVSDTIFETIVDMTINDADYFYTELHQDQQDRDLFVQLDRGGYLHATTLSDGIYRVAELLVLMKDVFFYASWLLLVFALVLIVNVMSASVIHKRRQIGILRALGASKRDVFVLFALEGAAIALVCLVLALAVMQLGIMQFNQFIRTATNSDVMLLRHSLRSVVIIALIAITSVTLGTYLPVYRMTSRAPIETIRDQRGTPVKS